MSVDRLLTHVLRQYQDVHDAARTEQIWSTTTMLLTQLSNPLNLSVLTSQLLTAPAIWHTRSGDSSDAVIRTSYRVISVFNTAAMLVRRREFDNGRNGGNESRNFFLWHPGSGLRCEAWTKAVIHGADDRSSRWRHLLVLTGVFMGLTSHGGEGRGGEVREERKALPRGLRHTLGQAVVTAANLALEEAQREGPATPGAGSIVLALNYVFPLLSESTRSLLNYDTLLAVAIPIVLGSADGLHDGLFLGSVDLDVQQSGGRLDWPERSPSFLHLRELEKQPLVSGLGPLSRLLAHAVKNVRAGDAVLQVQDDLLAFTEKLYRQWQAGKLSGMEISEQAAFFTPRTLQMTWPSLWQLLTRIMYATVAVLQSIMVRSLLDPSLRKDTVAPLIATKTLHILRNLYFVSSQHGSSAFQVYTFTYLTSIDTIVRYPDACIALLQSITSPSTTGSIPTHPLHRTLDLFYLNLTEHLPLTLQPEANDRLIIGPAAAYLTHPPPPPLPPRLVELFEAAHSATLSVLACPHNAPLTARLAAPYADRLLASFPTLISPRQFRLAFRTVIQALSPPFPLAAAQPDLAETLLEMVRFRAATAATVGAGTLPQLDGARAELEAAPISEQTTLVLTLIDALPFLRLDIVEEWMTVAAAAVHEIVDPALRETAKQRFWEVLASGEMDVERAALGVAWWGTRGGREMLLYGVGEGGQQQQPVMSGAIMDDDGVKSRL